MLAGDQLKPELARRGVRLHCQIEPALAFMFFNLTIVKASSPAASDRDVDALRKRNMDAIGIRITFFKTSRQVARAQ